MRRSIDVDVDDEQLLVITCDRLRPISRPVFLGLLYGCREPYCIFYIRIVKLYSRRFRATVAASRVRIPTACLIINV